MQIDGKPVTLRPMRETDRAYILDSWIGFVSSRISNSRARRARFADWFRSIVTVAVEHGKAEVACFPDAPDTILGWRVHDVRGRVYYCYVAAAFRDLGLGTWLKETPHAQAA